MATIMPSNTAVACCQNLSVFLLLHIVMLAYANVPMIRNRMFWQILQVCTVCERTTGE
jgi:hypothetical protein